MHVTAIIAAGGQGRRLGGAQPKQLLSVAGRPILERTLAAFLEHPAIDALIVALPQELVDDPPPYLHPAALHGAGKPVRLVAGGDRRQDSVANAFGAADAASDIIVIHDAARPFASADLIARTITAAAESGAALAALASRDTVKRTQNPTAVVSGVSRTVIETLPRETIYLAQTPQAFRRDVLAQAIAAAVRAPLDATDEATLVERAGQAVRLVEGEATNIKITTAEDLAIAEAIARATLSSERDPSRASGSSRASSRDEGVSRAAPARTGRAGTGYDLHRLVEGRPLVVGGVTIPSPAGALGHSDADVVCHAATDAILGAACLGDIGRHFPDTDPRWQDASSLDLLTRAVALVAGQGFEIGNLDVTVVLETPKIKDHVDAMRAAVAGAIGVDVARVSIKGKTNEGVDAIGRGEAIAAHAVVLIRAIP
jgi:2-C-methyl-D-erythritol 4-phosphate cytidylyltransferase/2-C-methyl-D-erythritol 2,4-cyclodiphosphate synthase